MRSTEITIDGEVYKVGKFNCLQVEEMVEAPQTEDQKEIKARMWQRIADSLNNVNSEAVAIPDLKKKLDLDGFLELHNAVMEFNNLRAAKQGESQAATEDSTGNGSVPASL